MAKNKKKIAILVGIGAIVGIGVMFLATVGLGKKKGVARLGMSHWMK